MTVILVENYEFTEWNEYPSAWLKMFPAVHRALASQNENHAFPIFQNMSNLYDQCAYWEAASYLIHALLGWSDPAKGVFWLINHQEQARNDVRLNLLLDAWNSHGQLELLLAWYASDYAQHNLWGLYPQSNTSSKTRMTQEWWDSFRSRWPILPAGSPYSGGWNPLHLHCNGIEYLLGDPFFRPTFYHSLQDRKAVVMLESASGWHRSLRTTEDLLPKLHNQSWYVDVVAKSLGWMGTFRRSRKTGLWFLGKHSIHMQGN